MMSGVAHFAGKSVLVTGAGGSIGSQLCHSIMSANARRLVLVSLTEAGLYNIERSLQPYRKYRDTKILGVLGSVADERLMEEILPGVEIVVHAAAHKHLPICESNPLAAIANNVFATLGLMDAAVRAHVAQFVLISTDKAVKPASIMGATKRLAELLLMERADKGATSFFTVRFGNVMDSAGSVLPLWREQIATGGPITLTDERCERYFMSISDAVDLISATIAIRPSSGTFVLDMGKPLKLVDLALQTIRRYARREIAIQTIGLRPGEKITEELHYGGELLPSGVDRVFRVKEPARDGIDARQLADLELAVMDLRSRDGAVQLLWQLVA